MVRTRLSKSGAKPRRTGRLDRLSIAVERVSKPAAWLGAHIALWGLGLSLAMPTIGPALLAFGASTVLSSLTLLSADKIRVNLQPLSDSEMNNPMIQSLKAKFDYLAAFVMHAHEMNSNVDKKMVRDLSSVGQRLHDARVRHDGGRA